MDDGIELINKWWQFVLYCVPQPFKTNVVISMNQSIAHSNNLRPGNGGLMSLRFLGNSGGRFAYNLHQLPQREFHDPVFCKVIQTGLTEQIDRFLRVVSHIC